MINTKPAKVEMIDEMKFRNCIHSLVSSPEVKVWWNTKRVICRNSNAKLYNRVFRLND